MRSIIKSVFNNQQGRKLLIILAILAVVLVIGLVIGLNYKNRPLIMTSGQVKIALAPAKADLNGIDPASTFILRANQALSVDQINKNLKFEPALDYKVSKSQQNFLSQIRSFLAASSTADLNNDYTITPTEPLAKGEIYKIETASSTELSLDHDYAWAFKVKDDFTVSDSLPSDQSTGVPVKTGIELTFNRLEIGQDAAQYFSINPAAPGKLTVGLNKLTFVPTGDLKAKTLYTVTIKSGYQSGEKGEILAEAKQISFETAGPDISTPAPNLTFNSDYSEMTPDKSGFLEANGDATSSEATVYNYDNIQNFLSDYNRYENRAFNWSTFNAEKFSPATGTQEVFKFQANLLKQAQDNYYGLIELPQKLAVGSYVIKLAVGESVSYSFVRVSPLAYYYSEINGDGLLWVYNFPDKQPFVNVKVSFMDQAGLEKPLGTTDANGLLKFDSSGGQSGDKNIALVFKAANLAETAAPNVSRIFEKRKNYFQGYLNTDRYAYRLTDKLHFWGVVKGRSFDLKEKKVKVSLDGLVEKEAVVSPFDTIEGELDFEGLASGSHNLTVSYNDETIAQSAIEVFSFQKPLYKITVATDQSFGVTDQPIKAKIKVNFFDGTPVANMDLATEISWQDTQTGTVRTDNQGEAEVSYTPKYYFSQTSDQYSDYWTTYPMSLRFVVRPALAEEGEIWGEADLNIYGPKITMSAEESEQNNSVVFKAKVNQLNLATSTEADIIGQPAVGQAVKAQIIKYSYVQVSDGEEYDPIEKVKVKKYHYETKKEILSEQSGQTDQAGEWTVSIGKQAVNEFSYLKAIFSAVDQTGKTVMSSAESYDYYQNNIDSILNLTNLDQDQNNTVSYKIGDQIHLKQFLTGPRLPVDNRTLIISYQEGLRNSTVVTAPTFTDTFTDQYLPSISYLAVKLMPNGFIESNNLTSSFDYETRRLKVEIAPDQASYRPKDQINLAINIKDQAGQAVKAVANVSAVDEALFNVTPWGYGSDILSSLYATISAYPNSLATRYVMNFKNGAEKGGCFVAGTQIKLGDGTSKPIEAIRVGDEIETFAADDSRVLARSIVQGVSSHQVNGYLLINQQLKVTPEHVIYLNGAWKPVGEAKIGDRLIRADGTTELIKTIEFINLKNVTVYNLIVGKYHTYFADNLYVHNAEKGGGGDARNFFEDTPLYQQFETDEHGQIKASFQAPDNLTSWRVSVNAYDQAGFRAGSSDKLVPVGLPLFADAVVAPTYLAGDQPIIKIRVFGSAYQVGQPTQFSLKCEDLNLNIATSSLTNEINLPLGALPVGKHKLVVGVSQGGLKDSVEKNFQVFENYVTRLKSDSQPVANGPITLQANQTGFTDLLFVDNGKGKYFDQLLSLDWQASVRSDIQAAAYLSANALNNYFYAGQPQFSAELALNNFINLNSDSTNVISIFPYGQSNYALTAELADALPEKLDQGLMVQNLTAKLSSQAISPLEASQVLYGLSALGHADLPFINYLAANASTTPEMKIYLALALVKAGDLEGARAIYADELLPLLKVTAETAYLDFSQDPVVNSKSTAALGILISDLESAPDNQFVAKILANLAKYPLKDNSTALEQAIIIKNQIAKISQADSGFSYQTASRNGKVDLSKGQTFNLTLSAAELASLNFSDVTGRPQVISYYDQPADPASLRISPELSIKRSYLVNGRATNDLRPGDLVTVRLDPQFSSTTPDDNYQVVDYLPAGLRPIIGTYSPAVQADNRCDPTWYPSKITDNAVYYNIGKWFEKTSNCQHRTLSYPARVVSQGEFKAEGAVIQSTNNLELINSSADTVLQIR